MTDCKHCGLILDYGVQRECPVRPQNSAGFGLACEPEPELPPMIQETRHRFHVRRVDARRQRYLFVVDEEKYAVACLMADMALRGGSDFIVWDSYEEQVLYDSRRF